MTENVLGGSPQPVATAEVEIAQHGLFRRLLRDPAAVASLVLLALVVLAAIFAPLLTSQSSTATKLADALATPFSPGHLLGTDSLGRDVFAQLLYGARTSLISAVIVVTVAMVIGVPFGVLAGYYRGWLEGSTSWISNALMSLPAIVVLLVVLARVGRSTFLALAVFGVLIAPAAYALVKASVKGVREELYVDAAKVSGLRDARIMRRHILPVVIAPSIIQAAQLAAAGIGIEAGIAFLGLGSADRASWGLMLQEASSNIYNAPWLLIWPSIALILTVMALTLIGVGLRDALKSGGVSAPSRARGKQKAPVPVERQAAARAPKPTDVDTDALLLVENLRVAYSRRDSESVVVNGVSLSVRRGEVLGLVGESGSGKSQTAFSILGLLPPSARVDADRLLFGGKELTPMSPAERNALRGRRIGYIPQEPMSNLDPSFRIGGQLTEPLRRHLKLSKSAAKAEALRLLKRVGINDPERVFAAYPHEISGGMAQRVLIAGAVSCNPELLIADEPTTALDVTVQAEVLDLIRDLQQERNMGVLLVTHNFGVVADICDTVAVMRGGQIVETAPVVDLFTNPQHEYTRMLLESTLENAPARAELSMASLHSDLSPDEEANR
jgi:peptide/nickel transport system permease protein